MALVVKNRVQENSTTTGTGTLTLSGAVSGFQAFSSSIGNGNTTYYTIQNSDITTEWEVGIGTVGAGTLSRDTVLESSNSNALVDFGAGIKAVFCTYPAEKSVDSETAQTLTNKSMSGVDNTFSNIPNAALSNSSITVNGSPVSLGGSVSVGTVTSVTGTAPISSTGGSTPDISIPAADSSTNGYLTSTDWSTFNGKQDAFGSKTANTFYASPDSASGVPSFRAIVAADVPTLNQNTTGTASNVTGTVAVANGGTGATTFTANNVLLGNGTNAFQVVAPSTSGNVLISNGTTWTSGSAPAAGLGIGQTWTNVAGSRAFGTTYTNSTGKPIWVSAQLGTSQSGTISAVVAGVTIASHYFQFEPANPFVDFVVPNGSTYSVSGNKGLGMWYELR